MPRGICNDTYQGYGCTSCYLGFFSLSTLCLNACPSGYTASSNNTCILIENLIFSLDFYSTIQLGTLSGFNIGSNSTNEYPNFDPYDPIPTENRGYYFNGTSYINGTGYSLTSDFYINIWIKVYSSGIVFSKGNYFIMNFGLFLDYYLNYYIRDINHQVSLYIAGTSWLRLWNYIELTMEFNSTMHMTINKLYLNTKLLNITNTNNYYFQDNSKYDFIIGYPIDSIDNWDSYFTGFIWKMQAFNSINNIGINYINNTCIGGCNQCSTNRICPGSCFITELEPTCASCEANCLYGCTNALNCNLCSDYLCENCYSFNGTCGKCIEGASLVNLTCSCNTGFIQINYTCVPCHFSCAKCNGLMYNNCISCASGFLKFIDYNRCLPAYICPDSFGDKEICIFNHHSLIFDATFNAIKDIVYDTIEFLPIKSGNNSLFYPSYSINDPWATKGRGYYFTDTSYMSIDGAMQSRLVLAPEFSISLWLFILTDGVIFSRSVADFYYIKFYHQSGIKIELNHLGGALSINISSSYEYNSWSLCQIIKNLNGDGEELTLYMNEKFKSVLYSNYYLDPITSVTTRLGQPTNSFIGYLWSLQIYNAKVISAFASTSECINPISLNNCLPVCSISQFMSSTCTACPSECLHSCGFMNSCNLCDDIYCNTCENYSTCTACTSNASFNITSGLCECNSESIKLIDKCLCKVGFYYNSTYNNCSQCDSSCIMCTGWTNLDCYCYPNSFQQGNKCICLNSYYYNSTYNNCSKCSETCALCNGPTDKNCTCYNNSVQIQNECVCNNGYYYNITDDTCLECRKNHDISINADIDTVDDCIHDYFVAELTLSSSNLAVIIFSQPLYKILEKSDLIVSINHDLQDYLLIQQDNSTYFIDILFAKSINEGDELTIIINKTVISYNTSIIEFNTLSIFLFPTILNTSVLDITELLNAGRYLFFSALTVAIGESIIGFNPSTFFNFFNCLEIYSYVAVFKLNIDETLTQFLDNLLSSSYIPNIFTYIIKSTEGVQLTGNLNSFGYSTSLFIINSGGNISIIIFFAIFTIFVYLLKRLKNLKLKKIIHWIVPYFKYKAFLRLYLQTCLEFSLNSSIGLYYNQFSDKILIFDFSLCCFIIVRKNIDRRNFFFFFFIYIIIKRLKIQDQGEIEDFLKAYGTVFEEFKEEKITDWMFYLLFVLRRIMLAVSVIFIDYPILQISLTAIFSLTVIII